MSHTAVIQLVRDLGKGHFICQEQLFGTFDLLNYDKVLYGSIAGFREKTGKIAVAVIEFFRQVNRHRSRWQTVFGMNDVDDRILDLLDQCCFLIGQNFDPVLLQRGTKGIVLLRRKGAFHRNLAQTCNVMGDRQLLKLILQDLPARNVHIVF